MLEHDIQLLSQIEDGVNSLHLSSISETLLQYLQLLHKWNDAYNLTAIRHMSEMINKHLMDSLAILPWIKGKRIIDVGTGAGLPGIPLAIAKPDLQFVLLDSNGKKTRFLLEVKRQLHLNNVEIVQNRVENYQPGLGFDTVLSRAFSSLEQMTVWTQHLIAPKGIWLAMKGKVPTDELSSIKYPFKVEEYTVKGIAGERCCVLIDNKNKE
ncbi:16S rRNA (guanine(527)-N(7))-methyltransferase RsmG [Legionella waltersii]|uniref:Ribosomal RNA small subunit methyltransferase G n=1 Tax=Legionella waltersii TaxID=66969 RepID=A0A0W1A4Y5_9GAMM|nr:16S rRNA (guanine(527)-N(7))-methyltransferase RsmG [Legionella waltersii]KTD76395.1 glucose inhibited division protein B GidB [Legionella waltersii]SNV14170.1 glucose inhibited division protein B GidB [Legionella waltersii]